MQVCTTTHLYHALLNTGDEIVASVLENGLRPLSYFPESKRWQQINSQMPMFFENLYKMIAEPVLKKPYENSGVFVSPIDFSLLPDSIMYGKTRIKIPVERINADYACLTYVIDDTRISLPLNEENLTEAARIWDAAKVMEWFGKDQSKVFFYVPQIAVYQPEGIEVEKADLGSFVKTA